MLPWGRKRNLSTPLATIFLNLSITLLLNSIKSGQLQRAEDPRAPWNGVATHPGPFYSSAGPSHPSGDFHPSKLRKLIVPFPVAVCLFSRVFSLAPVIKEVRIILNLGFFYCSSCNLYSIDLTSPRRVFPFHFTAQDEFHSRSQLQLHRSGCSQATTKTPEFAALEPERKPGKFAIAFLYYWWR